VEGNFFVIAGILYEKLFFKFKPLDPALFFSSKQLQSHLGFNSTCGMRLTNEENNLCVTFARMTHHTNNFCSFFLAFLFYPLSEKKMK